MELNITSSLYLSKLHVVSFVLHFLVVLKCRILLILNPDWNKKYMTFTWTCKVVHERSIICSQGKLIIARSRYKHFLVAPTSHCQQKKPSKQSQVQKLKPS